MTHATAPLDQTMTIEHSMDGAFGGKGNVGESTEQALANFASTPTGVLMLDVQNVVLHLKGKLVGVAIGTSAPVGETVNAAFLVAIEDLVASLAGDPELPAQFRHELKSFIHDRTLLPRHPLSSPEKERKCNLCVRYDLLPMCRVAHTVSLRLNVPRR